MGIDRSRRITFEEVADLYYGPRPQLSRGVGGRRHLAAEGGDKRPYPGNWLRPDNATLLFARHDYHLLGIESGQRLVQYARPLTVQAQLDNRLSF